MNRESPLIERPEMSCRYKIVMPLFSRSCLIKSPNWAKTWATCTHLERISQSPQYAGQVSRHVCENFCLDIQVRKTNCDFRRPDPHPGRRKWSLSVRDMDRWFGNREPSACQWALIPQVRPWISQNGRAWLPEFGTVLISPSATASKANFNHFLQSRVLTVHVFRACMNSWRAWPERQLRTGKKCLYEIPEVKSW